MILNGNQRGGAKDLALHLMKDENERVKIHEMRGFISQNLMGALNEIYAISRGTKCKQFMYSLSLNPPKGETASVADFEAAIERAEKALGLTGQPRVIVFHEKKGRLHAHAVWSRIDIEKMKAVQMSFDHDHLTDLSRELFLEHGWKMPPGLANRIERNPTNFTHAEWQQAQRIGKDPREIKAAIQEAWALSDSKASFEQALIERGYILARGDRGRFVAVDRQGEVYSIRQMTKLRVKELRARLGDEKDLLSIEEALAQRGLEKPEPTPVKPISAEDTLKRILSHHAAFTPRMMERTLKTVIPDEHSRKQVKAGLLRLKELIKIGRHEGQDVYTTQAMINLERRMITFSQQMAENASHPVQDKHVERAIDNLNAEISNKTNGKAALSEEQVQTLRHMTGDKQLSLVVGVAGAGKTTLMAGAKEALEAQGYRVRGAAPSGIAAAGLQEIGMEASTLHSLEGRINLAKDIMDNNQGKPLTQKQRNFINSAMLTKKDVLIVDEAGMVSAKQLANIIELTKQSGAKLILVGDPAQLQSVEAGAAFRTLLERTDSETLQEVRRQKTDWQREATHLFSQDKTAEALTLYEKHDCLRWSEGRKDAREQLVQDFMGVYQADPEKNRLVLAYTRKDVAALNTAIKQEMVKRGVVSEENTRIKVTVRGLDGYTQGIQGFSIGDRILFRENNRDMGVMNGTFGTIENIRNGSFHVRLEGGKTISFSPRDYNALQLGYAATVHKSQGVTVDEAFVLASPHFDRHTSYVAMSRHKERVTLYASADDFRTPKRLKAVLGKKGEKLSTLDFIDPQREKAPSWADRLSRGVKNLWERLRGKTRDKKRKKEPASTQSPEPKRMNERWMQVPPDHQVQMPERKARNRDRPKHHHSMRLER